jgi:RNA-directed DNA polymerase
MEEALGVKYDQRGRNIGKRGVVRYADDFVVFCPTREDAEQVICDLTPWLAERGLTLSPEKTRIVHLEEGFDFLGYTVRHYKDPRTRTGRKLLIQPSKDAVHKVRDKLKAVWISHRSKHVMAVCHSLNPLIRGWANYHRVVVSTRTFAYMDHWMFVREARWATRRHPHKSAQWRRQRYWGQLNRMRKDTWVFGDKRSGYYLLQFHWFHRRQHALVKGTASPDDPALRQYWQQRREASASTLIARQRRLARAQDYVCPVCGESLSNEEDLQIHHLLPRGDPQRNDERYHQLIHLLCHQQITKQLQDLHAQAPAGPASVENPAGLQRECLSRVH